MTREEAIKRLEDTFEAWEGWIPHNDSPASKLAEALGMAIAALREQEEYEILKNSYHQLQDIFDSTYASNMAMGDELRKRRWISVEDRLPPAYTYVLVCRKHFGRYEPIVGTDHIVITGLGEKIWAQDMKDWKSVVTHWMPMPDAPEVEG